jgi:uridine kinase
LVTDPEGNFQRLLAEAAALPNQSSKSLVVELIGNGFCRLHLKILKQSDLTAETLQQCFLLSAKRQTGSKQGFLHKMDELKLLCEQEILPFSRKQADEALRQWEDNGGGLFRHSEIFNRIYAPAYRVVEQRFCDFLPLLSLIDGQVRQKKSLIVAIDGRCAAGKSTLAALLRDVYGGNALNVLMMDQFFLRPEQRTAERLAHPGENVDHERFLSEVLLPLSEGKGFSYRPYDCQQGVLAEPIEITPKAINIVEGSYSLHPSLAGYYDIKVFMDIGKDEQMCRIRKRESAKSAAMFESRWIPLEEQYFAAMQVERQCDVRFIQAKESLWCL